MPDITPSQIEEVAQDAFAFLQLRPGCRREEDGERWLFRCFIYIFEKISFEVYIEYKDPTVKVHVCRTIEGHAPPSGVRVYNGQRVRLTLYEALMHGGDADRATGETLAGRLRSIPVRGPERIVPAIHIYADTLREVVDHLAGYLDLLFAEA
jgi:hypothetical protein